MSPRVRILASALALTGITATSVEYVKWKEDEGFAPVATIPTKGDRPTLGHGSTFWENGQPVKLGQRITRERAETLALHGLNKDQRAVAKTIPNVPLHPEELRIYGNFVGQFGIGNWTGSTMHKALLNGNYNAACHGLLLYKYAAGYDCSTPGNTRCFGVWTRQLERHQQCMEVQ